MNRRVLLWGAPGAGKRTLHHALGGPGAHSSDLFVDSFRRSLGDFQGSGADVWIDLVHGGNVEARLERERALAATCDAVIFVCDARPERLTANLRSLSELKAALAACRRTLQAVGPVVAVTHAKLTPPHLSSALDLDSPHWLLVGSADPFGANAVLKAAARVSAANTPRIVVWPAPISAESPHSHSAR